MSTLLTALLSLYWECYLLREAIFRENSVIRDEFTNCSVQELLYLCVRTDVMLFPALVLPVLFYGSETWSIGACERNRLN